MLRQASRVDQSALGCVYVLVQKIDQIALMVGLDGYLVWLP